MKDFAKARGAEYELFSKIDVNGPHAHPLYRYLTSRCPGSSNDAVEWNFSKFLCNRSGVPVKAYESAIEPYSCLEDIEAELFKE